MARRAFKVMDLVELYLFWHAGRRMGELSDSLRLDPKTIRKYVAPAVAAGITPGGPALSREEWGELAVGWFPEVVDSSLRQRSWPEIAAHHEQIKEWRGVCTVSTMHQRLRDDHGLAVSDSSLRRYIAHHFAEEVARSSVVVLKDTPEPGTEAQVDYGLLGRWRDPVTGRVRRVWGFLMVLSFSRLMFLMPVLTMDEVAWVECHIAAFNYFGGVVRRVVPDNLKAGVVKPDLYDPAINRTFGDLARHYDCLIDPARVRKPRDKARVERPVPYARDSFFAGRGDSFLSVAHMRTEALRWCDEVANVRAHRGIERMRPVDLFVAEERHTLHPLPARAFELARWSTRKVAPDIHVKVGRALYSVPWRHIGHPVECKEAARTVEIYRDGVLVCTHPRIERGRQTNPDHYPPEKIAFMMRTPQWCRHRAQELGPAVAELIDTLLEENALYRLRQAQGVVGLARAHGQERLEAACRLAISAGDPTYKTVKGILANGTEDDAPPVQQVPSAPAHLHGPDVLFEREA